MTRRTLRRRHVIHEPVAITFRRRLFQVLLEISEDAVKSRAPAASLLAVQQEILNLFGEFFERRTQIDAIRRRNHLQLMDQILRRRPWAEPAVEQRLRPVADDFRRIEIVLAAQSMALGASPVEAVKRKRTRLELRHVDPAIRT